MLRIKRISIKNFRSIQELYLEADQLNIFLGLNDAGKSNILKALNLFFNGETEPNTKYNFDVDYSLFAPYRQNKAKEIIISVTLEVPGHYADAGDVTWTKIWRSGGLHDEYKSKKFSPRSRANVLFDRIVFKYVPAVKSDDYFRNLLRDLYKTIAKDENNELINKATEYSQTLQSYTKRVSLLIKDHIGIDSTLAMPNDHSLVFQELIFSTKDKKDNKISLSHRGDGIKSMHIPAVLKYIAEKTNNNLPNYSLQYTTIWGYEEPENGIELLKCYDLANQIFNFSDSIQIFVTSHSPAFYSLQKMKNVKVNFIEKCINSFVTKKNVDANDSTFHEALGILPLITPLIEAEKNKVEELKIMLKKAFLTDVDTIFVEGITDKAYLEHAIHKFSTLLFEKLHKSQLRIVTRQDAGGTTAVTEWAQAWCLANFSSKLFILLDHDYAGVTAKNKIADLLVRKKTKLKTQYIPCSEIMESIFPKIIKPENYEFTIECLFKDSTWSKLLDLGYLQKKSTDKIITHFKAEDLENRTLQQLIDETFGKNMTPMFFRYEPHADKKTKIKDFIMKFDKETPSDNIFGNFNPLIKKIEQYFI